MIDKWILIALVAIVIVGTFQFLIKLTGGKLDFITGAVILQVAALAATVGVFLIARMSGWTIQFSISGMWVAITAGILIGVANVLIFYIFHNAPLVRVAPILGLALVVTVTLGMIVLKETVNLKIGAGIILAIAAILLLST